MLGAAAAARLGHGYVGAEHVLLDLLEGMPDPGAQAALVAAGVTVDDVERHLEPGAEGSRWRSPNPRWYRLMGRAEGLAIAQGDGIVRSIDVLVALLWDDNQVAAFDLAGGGSRREAVVAAMAAADVPVPSAALPSPPEWSEPLRRLSFPVADLDAVLSALHQRYPRTHHWGWNVDGAGRAWVDAEAGVDLEAIRAALGLEAEVESYPTDG